MRQFAAQVITPGEATRRGSRRAVAAGPGERVAAGGICFVAVLWPAVSGGGDDVVVRQELGIAIWWGLALGLAFGVLPRAKAARPAWWAGGALGALCGLVALGLLGTESAGATGDELARLVAYGGALAAIWLGVGPRTWRDAAAGIALAALVLPLVAVVWRLGLAGDLGADPAFAGERLLYPLGYWNGLAAWAAGAFAIAVSLSAHVRVPGVRALVATCLPVCGLALYLTASRGGIVALAVAVAVAIGAGTARLTAAAHAAAGFAASAAVVLFVRGQSQIADGSGDEGGWLVAGVLALACAACALAAHATLARGLDRRRPGPRARGAGLVLAGLVAALVVAALVAAIGGADDPVGERGRYAEQPADPAARLATIESGRALLWKAAVEGFADDPVAGSGAGTFGLVWARDGDGGEDVHDAHSLPLETAAEVGLPGLAALLVLLAALAAGAVRGLRTLRRRTDIGLAAGLVAAFAGIGLQAAADWLWELTALALLALGGLAVVGAAASQPSRGRRWRPGVRLGLAALAVLAGASMVPGIVAETRSRAAADAFRTGASSQALDYAGDAIAAKPWAAGPRALRAELELLAGAPAAARADAIDAIDREESNWRHRLLLARIEIAAGDGTAASAALADSTRLGGPDVEELARRARALGEDGRAGHG